LKKFLIIFAIILSLIFAALYFTTTEYFFNKFVAANIKEYDFDYKKAQGSLLRGFEIEELKYKDRELSSRVEFEFNPFKLLKGTISISKLHLQDVDKQTLTSVINDFKKDGNKSSASAPISFDFEFRDILLTIKPFSFGELEVNRNRFEIEYVSYINGKFNLGNSRYLYETNLGDIDFIGKFRDRILYIDKIDIVKLDINRVLSFIDSLKSSSSKKENNSTGSSNIAFLPKKIFLNNIKISLKPFNLKGVLAKDLRVIGEDAIFDVEHLKLQRANLDLKYSSNLADIKSILSFDKNILNISKADINILNPNKIETLFKNRPAKEESNKSSIDLIAIFPIKRVNIDTLEFKSKNYKFNNESIDSISLKTTEAIYEINSSNFKLKSLDLKAKSSLAYIEAKASVDEKIYIEKLNINSSDADKIRSMFAFNDKKDNSKTTSKSYIKIPATTIIKESNITFNNLSFKPYIIKKAKIVAKDIDINNTKFKLNSGELNLYALSNWGESQLKGDIKNSNFFAKGSTSINQKLLDKFSVPIRAKNLKKLNINGRFGLKSLELNATLEGKNILTKVEHFDILTSKNLIKYNYINKNLIWSIDALLNTPYTKKAKLKNTLKYENKKLTYLGVLKDIEIVDNLKEYKSIIGSFEAKYKGDGSFIDLKFNSNTLQGELLSKKYKKGLLKISNKSSINLDKAFNLGKNFKNLTINKLDIKAPINFKKLMPINADLIVKTNLADINGKINYKDYLVADLNIVNPKNLNIKNLNYKVLFPLNIKLDNKKDITIKLKNTLLNSDITYKPKSKYLNAKIKTKSLVATALGDINNIKADINSKNIYNTLKEINKIYKIKNIAKVDGAVKLKLNIKDLKRVNVTVSSNKLVYSENKSKTVVENILIDGSYLNGVLNLNRYKLKAKGYTVYANKSTKIVLDKNRVVFNNFWINDSATVNGDYNLNNKSGKLRLNSNSFKIDSNDAKVNLKLNTKIDINKNRYSISGLVDILNATIKKNITNKSVSDNEDIIILQKQRAKKSTNFAKNVKLDLKLISKGGIVYSQSGSYFKMYPKLKIKKRFGSLTAISGIIKLDKSSYYKFKDKKLKLKRGVVTFKGKSSTPYLNIVMFYQGKEYTIYINISGTSARPILYFSSNPPLTKDEILAYLLFGDSTAAGTHSQQSMLNLIGGTLAKSFFGAIGLKIDHISIKENGFSIGKSINDKITIFYNQDGDKPSIKTRIDVSKSVHTDIEIGEDSQSADIIFSKEY